MTERRFTDLYREETTLRDGSPVVMRLLRPEDKHRIVDGLARMSPESRFRRFFSYRDRLSPAELAYLTEIDQESHFAVGASRPGEELGLGVARFVVLPSPPEEERHVRVAEAAVAVVDEAQGKGLGRMLFERLINAAAERGVGVFRFDVLAENDHMIGLVKSLFPDASSHIEDGIMTIDCPIPEVGEHVPGERPEGALFHFLKLAAEGAIRVLRGTRNRDDPSAVLKSSSRKPSEDLGKLIGLTEDDGPGPKVRAETEDES